MKVLVVDDDKSLRKLMEIVFQEILGNKYKILLAEDGEEAMSIILNEENIKLVITDFNMPIKTEFLNYTSVEKQRETIFGLLDSWFD